MFFGPFGNAHSTGSFRLISFQQLLHQELLEMNGAKFSINRFAFTQTPSPLAFKPVLSPSGVAEDGIEILDMMLALSAHCTDLSSAHDWQICQPSGLVIVDHLRTGSDAPGN